MQDMWYSHDNKAPWSPNSTMVIFRYYMVPRIGLDVDLRDQVKEFLKAATWDWIEQQ
jgi:hypothetical protein